MFDRAVSSSSDMSRPGRREPISARVFYRGGAAARRRPVIPDQLAQSRGLLRTEDRPDAQREWPRPSPAMGEDACRMG